MCILRHALTYVFSSVFVIEAFFKTKLFIPSAQSRLVYLEYDNKICFIPIKYLGKTMILEISVFAGRVS